MANSPLKVLIGVALIIAVASIMAIKKGRSTSPTPPEALAASAAAPAPGETEGLPRLVDLGSTTCVPCKMMAPILEEIKREYAGRLQVAFIDVRASPTSAKVFRVRVIPTQIFYDPNGQERFRHEGFLSKEDILAQWRELGITLGQPGQPAKDVEGR
jgi:thioredoxin 1